MSRLLEILGGAMTVDTADLMWHWFDVVGIQQGDNESAQNQQLNKIVGLLGDKKLESAAEQLKLYLFENPSCIYGRLAAAAICLHKNQLQEAVEELNSVYMRQPSNTMALYALGHCYERLGKEAEAVEFYQDCLKFKNYLQLPRQRLAAIYFKNGQLEKTIQEYELLRDEYPESISMLVSLGNLYIAGGRYDNAIETFNTAILIHPDNYYAEDDYIEQLIQDGQLQEAAEQLENLLEEQPNRVDLIIKQADVLGMVGAAEQAISRYEEAIHVCPDCLEASIKLGTQYLQRDECRLAGQQFNRSVEINDQIVDAYIGLAIAQKLSGNSLEALATLSLATAIDANSSLLFAETATLQLRECFEESTVIIDDRATHLIEDVIIAHRNQIGLRPQNPDLHYRLGVLMMSVMRISEAIGAFERALEINHTYTRARNKLAICLFEAGKKSKALKKLIEVEGLDKNTLELHYRTALLYCDKIKFASSLINLERYMEENFAWADTTINISIVLQNLGLLDRVTAMWDNLADTTNQALSSGDNTPKM